MLYITEKEVKHILSENVINVCQIIEETFLTIHRKEYSLGGQNNASHGIQLRYTKDNRHNMFIAMPGTEINDDNEIQRSSLTRLA